MIKSWAHVVAGSVDASSRGQVARTAEQHRLRSSLRTLALVCAVSSAFACGSTNDGGNGPANNGVGAVPPPVKDTAALTPGLALSSVAIFQGVKVPVAKDGAREATKLPIVAGRPGVLRVYVTPDAVFEPREVTAVLTLTTGGVELAPLTLVRNVTGPSVDTAPASCFDFGLEAAQIADDTTFKVELTSVDLPRVALTSAPEESTARYPQTAEQAPLGATAVSNTVKVVLVPVQYNADGSGRTPETTDDAVAAFAKDMRELYPAANIDVSVHAPLPWATALASNGNGWERMLNAMITLRAREKPADDVYYYGMFMPTQRVSTFCQQGCVLGLSGLGQDPRDASVRASIGIGFPGPQSGSTMAHEIGHAHGRAHAPCGGVQGADRNFPYAQAAIGTLGYSVLTKKFIPSTHKDMMSYCEPTWISDYNYGKLFDRISAVNSAAQAKRVGPAAVGTRYRIASVDAAGRIHVDGDADLNAIDPSEMRAVRIVGAKGVRTQAAVKFVPYDHLPGGMLFIPEGENADGALLEGIDLQVSQHAFHAD
jgi:hypothetical protein